MDRLVVVFWGRCPQTPGPARRSGGGDLLGRAPGGVPRASVGGKRLASLRSVAYATSCRRPRTRGSVGDCPTEEITWGCSGGGSLIHTVVGITGGCGGLRTNRSGWRAYAAARVSARAARTA